VCFPSTRTRSFAATIAAKPSAPTTPVHRHSACSQGASVTTSSAIAPGSRTPSAAIAARASRSKRRSRAPDAPRQLDDDVHRARRALDLEAVRGLHQIPARAQVRLDLRERVGAARLLPVPAPGGEQARHDARALDPRG